MILSTEVGFSNFSNFPKDSKMNKSDIIHTALLFIPDLSSEDAGLTN